jgi:hypothetical protein
MTDRHPLERLIGIVGIAQDNVLAQFVGIRARNYRSGTVRSSSCAVFGLLAAVCRRKLRIRHRQGKHNTCGK